MPAGWVSAAVGVAGALSSSSAGKKQAKAQEQAQAMEQMIQLEQLNMAKSQWQRYLDTYGPLETEFVNEARNAGSIANQNKAAGETEVANKAAYATARERLRKSPGMNPSDQAYLQEVNKINLAEAAGSATGQNAARNAVLDRGNARMTDALSLGKGLPAQAASMFANSASTAAGLRGASDRNSANAYRSEIDGIGQLGRAAGNLFQSKTFQNWFNNSGNDMASFTGLGGNSNYAGITPESNIGSGAGGIDGGWNPGS